MPARRTLRARRRIRPDHEGQLWSFAHALSFFPYSLPELVEEVRAEYFPELPGPVPVFLVEWRYLACAVTSDAGGRNPAIYVHQVLNHPRTPRAVMKSIVKHELLHFVHAPRRIGRRFVIHTPEFWAAQKAIAPGNEAAWDWLWENIGSCLEQRPRLEFVEVMPRWRQLELGPRTPWREPAPAI